MGIAECLACAAVFIIIGVLALLYSSTQAQEAATRREAQPPSSRPLPPQTALVLAEAEASENPISRRGRTPPGGYRQPQWQYKYKDVPRYNALLGRNEPIRELVLVFE